VGLIAELARDRRCYVPVAPTADWQRLRHLDTRRDAKLEARTAARQQLADLLGCYWPAVLEAAASLDSTTLRACLLVACDPDAVTAMAYDAFAAAVAGQLGQVGATRRNHRVMQAVYAAAGDARKIGWDQPGAAERAAFALADLLAADAAVTEAEDRMVGLVDALGYRELAETVPGLSAVGAAAILAETGDPHRYDSGRCWAKHAGICPRDHTSGRFHGATTTSGRGRGRLRTAAWRAIWGLLPHHAVFAARYRHLTSRQHNPLGDQRARIALANKLLRELWTMFVHPHA
jgi:transposase